MVHMLDWIKRLLGAVNEAPLSTAPAAPARRTKTYQAGSGYVYQYQFEGRKCCGRETSFLFTASADRKTQFRIAVTLPESAVDPFQKRAGRRLAENERYGVAKIALFHLLDEADSPETAASGARLTAETAEDCLEELGIET